MKHSGFSLFDTCIDINVCIFDYFYKDSSTNGCKRAFTVYVTSNLQVSAGLPC